jgi:hypothetical protein
MEKQLFKNAHYNTPGHAHELTSPVYRGKNLFQDQQVCELFLAELKSALLHRRAFGKNAPEPIAK